MATDRELLEAAARAAGIEGAYIEHFADMCITSGSVPTAWNPLADDGDALRLAVKLRLDIAMEDWAIGAGDRTEEGYGPAESTAPCPYAAARRAIVRAAAALAGTGGASHG